MRKLRESQELTAGAAKGGTENRSSSTCEHVECGTSVPLSNAVKPPSRDNTLPFDDVWRLLRLSLKGLCKSALGDRIDECG